MVITARNPVHSVLFLILAFFNAAGLFVLLGAEFLAMMLVVVYVGAVAVLFLFVVMMLDVNFSALRRGMKQHLAISASRSVSCCWPSWCGQRPGWVAPPVVAHAEALWRRRRERRPTPRRWAPLIYTRYIYAFEGSGLILLVAMIGAIVLTHAPSQRRPAPDHPPSRLPVRAPRRCEVVKVPTGHGI